MIRKTTATDFDTTLFFVGVICSQHEPMCHCMGVLKDEVAVSFHDIVLECCKSNLSFMILDDEGNIASISLALPCLTYAKATLHASASLEPVKEMLACLDGYRLDRLKD